MTFGACYQFNQVFRNVITLSETWNSTAFIPRKINGISNYKSNNNFNQSERILQ